MAWPLSQDYNEALQNPQTSFSDAELRRGQVVVNVLGIPQPCSGNFADVYAVECPASKTKWAVKCFTREVHGLCERYSEISKYLQQTHLPFTVDFQYLEQGIRIGGHWYPILKMHWVEGFTLNAFVRDMLDKPPILEGLSRIWLRMAQRLREAKLAHADLQHGNVLLVPGSNASSLAVKLIDYDGMWVPSLANKPSGEVGHPSYQHPERLREGGYNQEVDRFPLLAIYVALRALVVGGRPLWERYDNGDNLLFRQADFEAPGRSPLFAELMQINDPLTRSLVDLLAQASEKPLEQTPLFQDLIPDEKPTASAATRGKAPASKQTATTATTEPNAFQDIDRTTASTRSRRNKTRGQGTSVVPWLVGGVVAACVLLGGAVFWAKHSKSQSTKPLSDPDQSQARADRIDAKKKPEEKPVSPSDSLAVGEVRRFKTPPWGCLCAANTPDGQFLLGCGGDNQILLWRVTDGRIVFSSGDIPHAWCIAIDPYSRYAAIGTSDGPVVLWDMKERVIWKRLEGHSFKGKGSVVTAVAFSPDGKRLLSAGLDYSIRLWDIETGKEVGRIDQHNNSGTPRSVAFSPDGRHFVIGNSQRNARVFNAADNKEVSRFSGHGAYISCVAVAPDNRRVVSGSWDKTARVWELNTGKELVVFDKHHAEVDCLCMSPDGRWVLSGGRDKAVRVWEMDSGREVNCFNGHDSQITAVGVLGESGLAFSTERDKTGERAGHIWRFDSSPAVAKIPVPDKANPESKDQHGDLPSKEIKIPVPVKPAETRVPSVDPQPRSASEASMNPFVGRWQMVDDKGGITSYFTLTRSFGVKKSHAPDVTGEWNIVGNEARIRWSDGWRDGLRLEEGNALKSAFRPGTSWNDPPTSLEKAIKDVDGLAVPGKDAQEKDIAEVRNIYKVDYDAARKPGERSALAAKLFERGIRPKEDPARRFACLSQARDLAAGSGDVVLSLRAIDELSKVFTVETLPMKVTALGSLANTLRGKDALRSLLFGQILPVLDEAEAADDYEAAAKLLAIAEKATRASTDRSLTTLISQRRTRTERLRKAYANIADAVKTLAADLRDAEANLTVGKFECFDKEDWYQGLPMLARGSDATLAELARTDRADPTKAAAQADLGQKWSELADKQSESSVKSALQRRARYWFRAALPLLEGDHKVRIASRLEKRVGNLRFIPGLVTELFAGENFEKRIKTRLDYKIDYNWGEAAPAEGVPADHFSIRWQGALIPPRAGKYKFILDADDGARLIVDGQSAIDCWVQKQLEIHTKEVALTAQPHALRLEFREGAGSARIHLSWSLEGGFKEQTISSEYLYHEAKQERLLAP